MDKQAQVDLLLEEFQEINPSNYNHDDVCELNRWAIQAYELLNGYIRTNPLVALDYTNLIKWVIDYRKFSSFKGDGALISAICTKFGSPAARIPSEDEIMNIVHVSELCKLANDDTPWQVRRQRKLDLAKAIHSLCVEVNK